MLENSGVVDPERIESYIAADGYQALHDVLHEMTPGGGGRRDRQERPARARRRGLSHRPEVGHGRQDRRARKKYVICNADEGDPGAFMDRSVLESDPHRVLEGMAIAAYAVGADQGYIYVRAEYPLAISRLQTAIKQAKQLGLLGSGIFESPFNFHIDLRIGAGAFVCGEETALMASIEGKRGTPRPRPPFPAESGLWGCPTLINNVETFANVPPIIRNGADWFAGIGTEKSKGTKVFALAGKITNTGLVEVPMGTTLRHDRRGHRRRRAGRRHDQGGADRRPVRRLHPGRASRHAGRLRVADQARLDHGLGRHDRDGRDARTWSTSPGSSWNSAWTNRAASASPAAPARCRCIDLLDQDRRAQGHRARPGAARRALRHGQEHQPVRPRPDGAQPGAEHAALLPQRVRGAVAAGRIRAMAERRRSKRTASSQLD